MYCRRHRVRRQVPREIFGSFLPQLLTLCLSRLSKSHLKAPGYQGFQGQAAGLMIKPGIHQGFHNVGQNRGGDYLGAIGAKTSQYPKQGFAKRWPADKICAAGNTADKNAF